MVHLARVNAIYGTIISMKILRRYYGRLALLAAVVIAVAAVLYPVNTYAANVNDSNKAHANAIEKAYVDAGNDAGIWISSAGKSYRDASVDVPYGNTSVGVQLRGSWYTRGYGYQEVTTSSLQSPNHTVTGIGGDFSRGTANSPWGSGVYVYNNSNYTTATLQVGTACSGKAGGTATVAVQLQSTFRFKKRGVWYIGDSSIDRMNVSLNCASAPWSTTGTTVVRVNSTDGATTAAPGDTIHWTHTLKNNGPGKSTSITSQSSNSGFASSSFNGLKGTASGALDSGATRTISSYATYTVTTADIGNTLCQQLQWTPTSSSGGENGTATNVCVTVPYDYSLTPSITLDKTVVDSGDTVDVTGKLANSGNTHTKDTTWQFSYITIPTGTSVPTGGNSASSLVPCTYYKNKVSGIACTTPTFSGGTTTTTGLQVFTFSSSNYTFPVRQAIVPDLPVGTKLCYALSVKARSSTSTDWQHSNLTCVVIGKHPVLQTYGGDVIVGRNGDTSSDITTSTKTVAGSRYGSWGEYGVIAAGTVSGMASASGYAGGSSKVNICEVSYLTLNNRTNPTSTCSASTLGSYTYGAASSTVANRFAITSTTAQKSGDVTISSLSSGTTYTNNASGSEIRLTMGSPATLPAGKWVVINAPNATVKIMGDLRYTTSALTKLSDIPQIVIIAKNIIVSDSVEQIDAWLIATGSGTEGRINTCGAGGVTEATTITSKNCDKKLTVNGPVITNRLILRRTAGAGTGTASGDPAEVFNLRPDSYLWALSLQTSTPKAQTVQTVELPPRY